MFCNLLIAGAVIFKPKFKVNISGGGVINQDSPKTSGTCHSLDLKFFCPQSFLAGACRSVIQGLIAWSLSLCLCSSVMHAPAMYAFSQCLHETLRTPVRAHSHAARLFRNALSSPWAFSTRWLSFLASGKAPIPAVIWACTADPGAVLSSDPYSTQGPYHSLGMHGAQPGMSALL